MDSLSDLAKVKAVVPQSVFRDGKSVLSADNEWTVEMARYARGEILYFSMHEDNPVIREHLRNKGRAVILRPVSAGEMITVIENRRETSLLLASQIPATYDGRLRVNVANALAASDRGAGGRCPARIHPPGHAYVYVELLSDSGAVQFARVPGQTDHHGLLPQHRWARIDGRLRQAHGCLARLPVISMPGDRLDDDIAALENSRAKRSTSSSSARMPIPAAAPPAKSPGG
ncbi:MAG: hypothetical protein R2848_06660 [Thermomicrobiales bacterium]